MNETLSMTTIGNPFGPSPFIAKMREEILSEALSLDAVRAEQLLKLKIADWLHVPTEVIGIGNGSTEMIRRISQRYIPGRTLVVPVPTYFGIISEALHHGATIRPVQAGTQQEFDLNSIAADLAQAASEHDQSVLWLCNPNNPSGRTMNSHELGQLIKTHQGMTIVDEAYQEALRPEDASSVVALTEQYENLLVTKTFSKAFGLPALKVGFVIGSPRHIEALESGRTRLTSIQSITARFALDDLEHISQYSAWLRQELATLYKALGSLPHIEASPLSYAGMLLMRNVIEPTQEYLQARRVEARNANEELGIEGEKYVRIGLQQSPVNEEFLSRLAMG